MVYDLASFETYFNGFINQFGIRSVVIGGYDELIKLQSSTAAYPVLVIETPTESDDLDIYITFETRIAVLNKWGSSKLNSEYKADLTACRNTLKMVLDYMSNDTNKIIYRPTRREIEYIDRNQMISGDALFGAICTNVSFTSNQPCP